MKPLDGIKVVDFTEGHDGSVTTMLLADFGAEVIKIEKPGKGDVARTWGPFKNGSSGYHAYLNRGKKSIAVDAKAEEGKKIVLDLIKEADVVMENLPYGKMEHMGFGYEDLKKVNPAIIYASLTGYGKTGPDKEKSYTELQMQAGAGMMDRSGFADLEPTKGGPKLASHGGAMYAATAIVFALAQKEKTGEGQQVDVSMYDCIYSVLEGHPMTYCLKGKSGKRMGNSDPTAQPYDTFETNDGYVAIGVSTDPQWEKCCDGLGMDDLKAEEKYKLNADRCKYYDDGLRDSVEAVTKKMSKFEVEEKLWEQKLPCGAVYTPVEAMETEQAKTRDMVAKVKDAGIGEEVSMPGLSIHLAKTPGAIEEGAPTLGRDTRAYLTNLGYSEEEIQSLADKNIIAMA